jgi:hypothetical protein
MLKALVLILIPLILISDSVASRRNDHGFSESDWTRAPSQLTSRYSYWESFGEFDGSTCNLDKKLKKEIKSYQEVVDLIMKSATTGNFKGETYKHLSHFTDNFGSRLVTSPSYNKAVSFFTRQMLNVPTLAGRVFVEDVSIPNWKRFICHFYLNLT